MEPKQNEIEAPKGPFNREEIEKTFKSNPLLKGFSKYLGPILDYMETVEQRLQASDLNFQKIGQFLEKMGPLVNLSEQLAQRQAQMQNQPQTAAPAQGIGGGIADFLPILAQVMGGVGGSNPIQDKVMTLALESLGLGNALQKALIIKLIPDAADNILKSLEPNK